MTPQGTPAKSCSAFWQIRALSQGSSLVPVAASSKVAIATSSAALLDSPPPSGRSERITRSSAGDTRPRWQKPLTTPRR